MNYWLMKSEPDDFSIDDLQQVKQEPWNGVRNYQARNFMRDDMRIGDRILFYHSNTKPPGIVGIAEVASTPYADATQFDPESKYFDPKSDPDAPRWQLVDVRFVEKLEHPVTLSQIKDHADALGDCPLVRRGNRLSVMPIAEPHYQLLLSLSQTA